MATQHQAPEELVERVQDLLGSLDEIADPVAQARVQELVGAVLELYGAGLERILGVIADAGEGALHIRNALLDDGIVASLLLIHGLYPVPLEERIAEALDSVRPFLASHGGNVELLSVEDGVARLQLQGSCNGCPSSASTLEHALKEAIDEAAPDLLASKSRASSVSRRSDKSSDWARRCRWCRSVPATLPMADAPYTECPSGVGK